MLWLYSNACVTEIGRNELKHLAIEVVKLMSLPGSITDVLIWLFKGWVVYKMTFLSLLSVQLILVKLDNIWMKYDLS